MVGDKPRERMFPSLSLCKRLPWIICKRIFTTNQHGQERKNLTTEDTELHGGILEW